MRTARREQQGRQEGQRDSSGFGTDTSCHCRVMMRLWLNLSPGERMSCYLTKGLAFQFVAAGLLERVAQQPAQRGSVVLFNSGVTLGGEIWEPEREGICQSPRQACCHQRHYLTSSLTGGAAEPSAGGAGGG